MTAAPASPPRFVVMRISPDGSMGVTVDGVWLASSAGGWTRESFAAVLDVATNHRRASALVEVHESDGSDFVVRVAATPRRLAPAEEDGQEVAGDGFLPGEEVAIAVVTHHRIADPDGTVRVPSSAAPGGCARELLLVGRDSGTLHVAAVD